MAFQQEALSDSNIHSGSAGLPRKIKTACTPIVTTTMAHSLLQKSNAEFVRFFLSKYDNYVRKLAYGASPDTSRAIISEAVQHVARKDTVGQYYLESLLLVGFIADADTYDDLQDADLRSHLKTQARASKHAMKSDKVDRCVRVDLKTRLVADLVSCGLVYSRSAWSWACAPLLVPKDGSSRFRFTVNLRPVNNFTKKHRVLIPNIAQ